MAGILPQGGVNGAGALNAIPNLTTGVNGDLAEGCSPLFYGTGCRVQFDPAQANAVISELLNVMRDRGIQYDCSRLDNLSQAVGPHMIGYEKTVHLPTDPWPVKNGDDSIVKGSFTVPNTYNRAIECFCNSQLTTLVKTLAAGNDENLDVNLKLSNDSAYDGKLLYTTIQMRRQGSTDYDSWQTTKSALLTIPPGGRTFFYELTSRASAANSFELKEDFKGCKWKFFGVSYLTSDILSE